MTPHEEMIMQKMSQKVRQVPMTYPHLCFMVEKQQIQAKLKLLKSKDLFGLSPYRIFNRTHLLMKVLRSQ